MKKLAKLSPGRIFNFAGEKFVVMEQRDGAAFVRLRARSPARSTTRTMRRTATTTPAPP